MSFLNKLQKIQIEKTKLIEKRLFEIAKLAERAGVLGSENTLLLGAFALVNEAKTNPELFDKLEAKAKKIPSRKKSVLKKIKDTAAVAA